MRPLPMSFLARSDPDSLDDTKPAHGALFTGHLDQLRVEFVICVRPVRLKSRGRMQK